MSTPLTKLGALAIKGGLKQLMAQVSPDTYGGAPLLGVKGALLVGHGSSNALAVKNGVLTTARIARTGVSDIIAQTVATPCAAEATEASRPCPINRGALPLHLVSSLNESPSMP